MLNASCATHSRHRKGPLSDAPEFVPPTKPASQPPTSPHGDAPQIAATGDPSQPPNGKRLVADRYELHELLGSGGMGRVFRALDTRLKRWIAIKLLLGAGAEASRRLLQEAQAQARVEHEHVCRVYEVGWNEEGEPFIVMQLIEGQALADVTPDLTFEQRVRLVQQVSEAVHAANRIGVIHRDLKPGNVLVERTADGAHRSYVTDFGLARDATAAVTHGAGSVVGTPNYMAPEQARGETSRIDRRTDVYGLGATLYEVLSGKLPFEGNAYDVLNQVTRSDPRPLRKLNPNIPRDLAAIAGKCMEKEPNRRYDSARALTEDLQRWLDGAPILAQPPSIAYRASRLVRRHRTISLSVAAIALVAAASLVGATRARSRAREMAERFGQDVKEIEGRMRFAQVLPLHDISDDEADVRDRMARIEREMKPLGEEGLGPGEYALGRGALALGEAEWARAHFQRAWNSGYQSPDCATGLGLSLVALYRAGLQEADRLTDKKLREHRRTALAQLYRAPAKAALLAGAGATTEPAAYVEALIRFCDEDLDGAAKVAQDALLEAPWLYEARILLGQIHRERGLHHRANGDDAGAVIEFALSEAPLRMAVQFGRSDPRAWGELCGLQIDELELQFARGGAPQSEPDELFSNCENGVLAAPARAGSWRAVAESQRTWAAMQLRNGADPSAALKLALEAANKSLALKASDADASLEKGLVLRLMAQAAREKGEDALPTLALATDALGRALATRAESVQTVLSLSRALTDAAEESLDRGVDASVALARALELLGRAQALDAEASEPHAGLGRARLVQARTAAAAGHDPLPLIDQAIAELQTAAGAGQTPLEQVALATAYAQRAESEVAAGSDPSASAQAALAALAKSQAEVKQWPAARLTEARVQTALAQSHQRAGDDATGFLVLARAALHEAERAGRADAETKRTAKAIATLSAVKPRRTGHRPAK